MREFESMMVVTAAVAMLLASGCDESNETDAPADIGADTGAQDVATEDVTNDDTGADADVTNRVGAIRVELSWTTAGDDDLQDNSGADLDLHFMHPSGGIGDSTFDVHYLNRDPLWEGGESTPELTQDSTNGTGTEIVEFATPFNDRSYRVGVHCYSDHSFGESEATIEIFVDDTLAFSATQALDMDDYWDVASISWPSGTVVEDGDVLNICDASEAQFPSAGCL